MALGPGIATDDETRTGSMESDAETIPSTLDDDLRDTRMEELLLDEIADFEVFVQVMLVVAVLFAIPAVRRGERRDPAAARR